MHLVGSLSSPYVHDARSQDPKTRTRHAVICALPRSTIFPPHYLANGAIFAKKSRNTKCAFWFSVQLLSETFLILRRTERDMTKNVYWLECKVLVFSCQILIKLEFSQYIFEKYSNINFHENPSSGSRVVTRATDEQTDMTKPIVAFRNLANAPKNMCTLWVECIIS